MRSRYTVMLFAVLAVVGCAPTKDLTPLFREQDFVWAKKEGTASLKGQAFARTMSGEVRYCAGLEVYLVPYTPYTAAYAPAIQEGYKKFAPHPPAYAQFRRTTIGDATGSFEFERLPAGAWYVGCALSWYAPTGYGMVITGAVVERRIVLTEGQSLKVVVTPDTAETPMPIEPERRVPKCLLWC